MVSTPDVDREAIHAELERVRADFHHLLDGADATALSRRTDGTRWTNEELLFHMLFGYLIIRALLPLVRLFARLPASAGRSYARLLDASTGVFDQANYFGAVAGSRVFGHRRLGTKMDRTVAALHRSLDRETEQSLAAAMHFPARWDRFFRDVMTVGEVYHYAAQHYDFHRDQLTLDGSGG